MFVEATEEDLKAMGANPKQIAKLKYRQAQRGKGFSTGDDRVHQQTSSKPKPKALPGSSALAKRPTSTGVSTKGGALAKRDSSALTKAADKGKAIVKAKQKKASGSMMTAPDTSTGGQGFGEKMPGGWDATHGKNKKVKPKKNKLLKNVGKVGRKVGGYLKGAAKRGWENEGPEVGTAESGDLKGAPRGIYNPK